MEEQRQNCGQISTDNAIGGCKSVRRVDLEIPVAVYTATHGYDWSRLPDSVNSDEVDGLYSEVKRYMLEFHWDLSLGDVVKGVILKTGYAFAFTFRIVEKWDQKNRDANYFAVAFVPLGHLADIDFDRLLGMDYFTRPSRAPENRLRYIEDGYAEPDSISWDRIYRNLVQGQREDFPWKFIGPILANRRADNTKWTFVRLECRSETRSRIVLGDWNRNPAAPGPCGYRDLERCAVSPWGDNRSPRPSDPVRDLQGTRPQTGSIEAENHELRREIESLNQTLDAIRGKVADYERQLDSCRSQMHNQKIHGDAVNIACVALAFVVGMALAAFLCLKLIVSPSCSGVVAPNEVPHGTNGAQSASEGVK